MKRDPKEIVEFGFVLKYHPFKFEYALDIDPIEPTHEVKGFKTLKMFKSWFKLARRRHHPLYGFVKFKDGETWIWQQPTGTNNKYNGGGWQRALKSDRERERSEKARRAREQALWEEWVLSTAGFQSATAAESK